MTATVFGDGYLQAVTAGEWFQKYSVSGGDADPGNAGSLVALGADGKISSTLFDGSGGPLTQAAIQDAITDQPFTLDVGASFGDNTTINNGGALSFHGDGQINFYEDSVTSGRGYFQATKYEFYSTELSGLILTLNEDGSSLFGGMPTFTAALATPGDYTLEKSGIVVKNADGDEVFRIWGTDPNPGGHNGINLYIGKDAGFSQPTANDSGSGRRNIGIGTQALYDIGAGSENMGIGWQTMYSSGSIITGSFNTAIGSKAGPDGDYSNTIALGQNTTPLADNHAVIGNADVTDVYFGSESAASNIWANQAKFNSDVYVVGNFRTSLTGGHIRIDSSQITGYGDTDEGGSDPLNDIAIISNSINFSTGSTGLSAIPALILNTDSSALFGGNVTLPPAGILKLGNTATTGLVAGALAALTTAKLILTDQLGNSYEVPCKAV